MRLRGEIEVPLSSPETGETQKIQNIIHTLFREHVARMWPYMEMQETVVLLDHFFHEIVARPHQFIVSAKQFRIHIYFKIIFEKSWKAYRIASTSLELTPFASPRL